MVIGMKWLSKLLGRPAKSEDAQEALAKPYVAETATPPSEEPTTSEPTEPSGFRPTPGDKVRAAHEKDAVSGMLYVVELVRFDEDGRIAVVTDGETSWSVAASSLQPVE
jgi:hypothetical protein